MDPQTFIDLAMSMVTLLGSIATGAGAVWVFFRKRIHNWWQPYKAGLEGAAQVPRLKDDVEVMGRSLNLMAMHMRARSDTDIETAQFESDETGANTYVNLTYARWLGVGKAELLGWGWINFVHPDDRIYVRQEWDACRHEHRKYNVRFRFLDSGGDCFEVDVLAMPIPDLPPAKQWLGVVRRVIE